MKQTIESKELFLKCSTCGSMERIALPTIVNPEKKTDWTMNTTPDIRYKFKNVANEKRMPLDQTLAYLVWLHEQVQKNKIATDFIGTPNTIGP